MMEGIRTESLQNLKIIDSIPVHEGSEKTVYKATDGRIFLASKLYKDRDENDLQITNKDVRAVSEFRAYNAFKRTAFGIYVPFPYCLLEGDDEAVVGLAVEWKEGRNIGDLKDKRQLPISEIEGLRLALLGLPEVNLIPDEHMYAESNFMFNDIKPCIWFAECHLADIREIGHKQYESSVNSTMDYIREVYGKRG